MLENDPQKVSKKKHHRALPKCEAPDPELVSEVLRVVEQLAREGMTLILMTHETRFARDVGTKLVFTHHGKVHEEGVPKEVFAAPRTPELQQFVGQIG